MQQLRSAPSVRQACGKVPWLAGVAGSSINECREAVLLHECPEDLRMSVVAEFIATEHRLPELGSPSLREQIAATVSDPSEIDNELRHLASVVSGSPTHP